MSEEKDIPTQEELVLYKLRQLQKSTAIPDTLTILQQVLKYFQALDLKSLKNHRKFLYDCIKPISRQVTNINVKMFPDSRPLLSKLVLSIVSIYIETAIDFYIIDGLQLLRELLERSTQLLKVNQGMASAEQLSGWNDDSECKQKTSSYENLQCIKQILKTTKSGKTELYYKCCNQIINRFQPVLERFHKSSVNFVKEYFMFLDSIEWYIKASKIQAIYLTGVKTLETIFMNPAENAHFFKDVAYENLQNLATSLKRVVRQNMEHGIKKRIEIMPSFYALWMLFEYKSIEKKINALKMLNKWARHFTANPQAYMKEEEYCRWLVDQKVINFIFENGQNITIAKTCNDIIRLFLRRKCLSEEGFNKLFDVIQTNTSSEVRQLIFKYMDMESLKLQYNDYQIIIDKFSTIHRGDFYEEQMFNLLAEIIRYAVYSQNKKIVYTLGEVMLQNWGNFRNQRIQSRCMATFVKAVSKVIERNSNFDDRIKDVLELYDKYMSVPSKLGVKIVKNIINGLPDVAFVSKGKAAAKILGQKSLLQDGLKILSQNIDFKEQFQDFLIHMLQNAKDSMHQKVDFTNQSYFSATQSPKIFTQMLDFLNYSDEIQQLFQNLVSRFEVDGFPFSCLKAFFYRLNRLYVSKICEPYADNQYQLAVPVTQLKGFQNLTYLLINAKTAEIRNEIADFITELYTIYREEATKQGEEELKFFMKKTIAETLESSQNQDIKYFLSNLTTLQYLMMATQSLGPGQLRPHNSLVATSTVSIKVYNQITDYNDVLKVFEKKMPSNMLVFDLIEQLSKHFKCSPCELMFREKGQTLSDKWNGLTLEESGFDNKALSAVKSFRERIRREPLMINDELNPRAKKAFEQIFYSFAVDGKMGKSQCAKYVEGVTKTSCYVQDHRVSDFFNEWDEDKDDNITLNDFLRFYKSSCVPDKDKNQLVWRNLTAMKYRKNLHKYDEPIDPPAKQLLFRSYLSENEEIYKLLFKFTKSEDSQIRQRCMKILFRLPTCPFLLSSLSEDLKLIEKDSFETQYLLITLIYKLNSFENKMQGIQIFVSSGNAQKIFEMILRIDQIKDKKADQMKCLYITLQILRYLSCVPNLRGSVDAEYSLEQVLTLPETDLFLRLIKKSLYEMDIQALESSLALQISQKNVEMSGIIDAAFHNENEIRKMICNYVFICEKIGKVDINLFEIKVQNNCEYWYQVLEKIIHVKETLNFEAILYSALKVLTQRSQNPTNNQQDMIIFGNLLVIKTIIYRNKAPIPENLFEEMKELSARTISNKNRQLIYELMGMKDLPKTFDYLQELLASVNPKKEVMKKNYFVGIKNLGSTCYMNSILQILFHVQQFRSLIFRLPANQSIQKTEIDGIELYDDVLYQLQKMYTHLQLSNRQYYHPKQFCLTIKDPVSKKPINPNIQEDVHEFIGRFLESLENYMKDSPDLDIFKSIFEGKTLTEFTCQECHNKIIREQNFCQLSLQVKHIQNLQKSLEKFIEPEEITQYFCEQCQHKVQKISRSTYLSGLPKILIVNLRRIIFDLETFCKIKLDSQFKFPFEIDVGDYTSKEATNLTHQDCYYELKGIAIHSGTSQSGHYYSIIKIDNEWYKFNDQTVTKFDIKDLSRQAFGGEQSNDQWNDQLKFSTNAYILFYEKKSKTQIEPKFQMQVNSEFVQQIEKDNTLFFKELQVHQESIFDYALSIFQWLKPTDIEEMVKVDPYANDWKQLPQKPSFQMTFNLILQLLEFMETFYDIRNDIIPKIGTTLYQLIYLLPEKAYYFLTHFTSDFFIDNMCLHNDDCLRCLYSSIIPKCLHVYSIYHGLVLENNDFMDDQAEKIRQLLDKLYQYMTDEKLHKNIYKSYRYFEMWKVCCEYIPTVFEYMEERETLVNLVDILMGNDSPLAEKDKKRPQIPQNQSIPIINLIYIFMLQKANLVDYISPNKKMMGTRYKNLTEKQKQMIGNIDFYKKMIKTKCDNHQLAIITGKLSQKDEQFSKKLVQMFLKGLNRSYDEIQSSILMINHLKEYLLIEDEYTEKRMKWVLGIPQLQIGDNQNYGIRYSDESIVQTYISSLFFIQNDQYQPALQVLFMKRTLYTEFSIAGVALLLELLRSSQSIFRYIMSLPAPTYIYRSYPDWIWEFIVKLRDEDSYYLQVDKNVAFNKLSDLYKQFENKLKDCDLDLPVNKFIIGINKECNMIASLQTPNYEMALWSHHTYALENLPTGTMNKSLPKQYFKFSEPAQEAKYYLSMQRDKQVEPNDQLFSMFTMFTLHIDAKKPLKITFKFENFKEEIYFQEGKIFVNFPYEEMAGMLEDYLDIVVLSEEQNVYHNEEKMMEPDNQDFPTINEHMGSNRHYYVNEEFTQKHCSQCTYINFGRDICEMCGERL